MLDTTTRPQQAQAKARPQVQAPANKRGWGLATAAAAIVALSLGSFWIASNVGGEPATVPQNVTGFEYNTEATTGQIASPGVTTQYFGNSGELFPEEAPVTIQDPGNPDSELLHRATSGAGPAAKKNLGYAGEMTPNVENGSAQSTQNPQGGPR